LNRRLSLDPEPLAIYFNYMSQGNVNGINMKHILIQGAIDSLGSVI